MRMEREAARSHRGAAVITTVLSLLVVVAAVAVVAYLVFRSPSAAVDSAQRLDPVGTALPAPTAPPTLPAVVPTEEPESEPEPEPTALGFSGEAPAVAGLPTVAAPAEPTSPAPNESAGPTPTPRVIAQPTEPPPTPIPPPPTLPPSLPVTQVPVVELQPVEAAPPPAPTSAPVTPREVTQPTPAPSRDDNDPFNIFDDENDSRIVPVQEDPLERVRAMQEQRDEEIPVIVPSRANDRADDHASVVPTIEVPIVASRDDPFEVVVPDVDAMIDDITARAIDPNRNPNAGDAGRRVTERDERDDRDESSSNANSRSDNRRKSIRDRIKERTGRSNPGSGARSVVPNVPVIVPGSGRGQGQQCNDPFANLPDDRRPAGFPKC